jgi:hypothetical protein
VFVGRLLNLTCKSMYIILIKFAEANDLIILFLPGSTFEQWLKSLDSSFGVRNLEDVQRLANEAGFEFLETIEMPANNLSVLFRKL